MHYVINNCIIKSENAALSSSQRNQNIVKFINELPYCDKMLDYGCGKCRYSPLLNDRCKKLYLADSQIQLKRTQTICGNKTSVEEYSKKFFSNSSIVEVEKIKKLNERFDFILCTNVLSAIPFYEERMNVLRNIFNLLKNDGRVLVSVQYRNSYFNTYKSNPNAIMKNDGWLIKKGNSYSFYALISPNKLIDMCYDVGFKMDRKIIKDGSIYLFLKI